jgi:hypothetical protein
MSRPAPDRPGLPRPQADPGADVDTAPLRCCRIAASLPGLPGKYPPGPAARHAQLFQAVIRACEGGRAWAAERFWQQALTLVPGAGGQLCGTEARPAPGRDPLLAGQAAVLGRGLVRAPLRLARRPGPHGHNIVLMNLTTGFSARAQESRRTGPVSQTATASVMVIASRHSVSSG